MTVSVTNYGNNPQVPGAWDASYYPDQLIAGDMKIVTDSVTITGAALLKRGTVMGQVAATGAYRQAVATATDGSQNPCAVLVDLSDSTAGDVRGGVYLEAEVNGAALVIDPSLTLAAVKAAFRPLGLFVKAAIPAADPS